MHRRQLILATALAVACATGGSARAAVTPTPQAPAPQLSSQRLTAIALGAARADGDAHPTLIQDAKGSRRIANVVAGGEPGNAWNVSDLIAERGSFGTPTIPHPPGIPMGPGPVRITRHVLTLVVDAHTGRVTARALSDRYPDLARLGRVTTL